MNPIPNSQYPQYFRKGGTCIRQDGPQDIWTIALPPDVKVPCRWPTAYPTEARLQEHLRTFEPCDEAKFKEFLFTYYQGVAQERDKMNNWVIAGQVKPATQTMQ